MSSRGAVVDGSERAGADRALACDVCGGDLFAAPNQCDDYRER